MPLTRGSRTHLSQDLFDDLNRDDLPAAYFRHMNHVGREVAEALTETRRPTIEQDSDSWAGNAIENLHHHLDSEEAWLVIERLVAAAANSRDLSSIGAGPLEDLMRVDGGRFVDRLGELVGRDDRWAYAAGTMYETSAPAAASVIGSIRDSHGRTWKEFGEHLDAMLAADQP